MDTRQRPPTVVPLTKALIQQLVNQQQQGPPPHGATALVSKDMESTSQINVSGQNRQKGQAAVSVQVLTNNVNPSPTGIMQPKIKYTYKVKIVGTSKTSAPIVRYLHNFTDRFQSVNGLRLKLMDEFQSHVLSSITITFDVGYFEAGKQQSKIWLVTSGDVDKLCELHPRGG